MGRNFSIKYVSILIIGFFCAIAMFSVGIFALKKVNFDMQVSASPDIFCKIEVGKAENVSVFDATNNSNWITIFNNKTETLSSLSETHDSITREWVNGAMRLTGGFFNNITSSDTIYYRITNYTTSQSLNVSLSNTEDYLTSNPSYGVQNIAPYTTGDGISKYFSVNANILFERENQTFSFYLYLSNNITKEFTVSNANIIPQQISGQNVCEIVNKNPQLTAIAGKDYMAVIETTDDDYAVQITGVKLGILDNVETFILPSIGYYYDYSTHTLIVYGTALPTDSTATYLKIFATTKPKYVEVEINYGEDITIGYNGTTHTNSGTLSLIKIDTESGFALSATPSENYKINYVVFDANGSQIQSLDSSTSGTRYIFVEPNKITSNLIITITQAEIQNP